ncbi:Transcriptional activator protein, LysR family [Desulfonema limicola]|uniref:Transcriptional activator protein, LysR family n=1 Tax=Desulfonema limicola TaxID=45656 RepID=A0A975GJ29_9BACT|nr:selenium metabolism-associated LysR family transcriptional regulator [Desulfonema limicola]QTA82979.1 Transcriptional activator protein, LysR family [Desulfonema limicola]
MDLWQLNIFCKVVEFKSFSKAGKKANLSQPTVSSHIKDLEDHFGCRLIDRLSKEAVPTSAGKLLYEYAKKLLRLRDETETALAEFHGNIQGRLIIGGSTIPGVYILPRIIGSFVKEYPGVTISLVIEDTEKIVKHIVQGSLELGIVGAEISDKKIFQEKLISDEMCLFVSQKHKWADLSEVDMDMLFKEPFIIREPGSGTLKSFQASLVNMGCNKDDMNIIAEMGSTAAVIQGIKNNIGVSILSRMAVSDELQEKKIKAVAVKGLDLIRSFYLTTYKYKTPSPIAGAFMSSIKKEIKAQNENPA